MNDASVKPLTGGYYFHFFGYYDKCPWDRSGRYLLCMRTAPFKRYMVPEDMAVIGVLDTRNDYLFRPVTQTTAWNWQQGCHAAWLGGMGDGLEFIHNIRTAEGFGSAIVHAENPCEPRSLPLPVYSVTSDSRHALCLNFARLRFTHSTIGYAQAEEVVEPPKHPADDGLSLMDLATGEHRLIISLEHLYQTESDSCEDDACHWITHVTPNPSGKRIVFLHRQVWRREGKTYKRSRLITANLDGSELKILTAPEASSDNITGLSHPKWFGDNHVMVWNSVARQTQYYADSTGELRVVGEGLITGNGHFSQCPVNPDWMISDTYPDKDWKHPLFLYQLSTDTRLPVAQFTQDQELKRGGDLRCDLHPRWSKDGKSICVDSSMAGDRQMYLVDVSHGPHLK